MYADHLRARRIDPVGVAGAGLIGGVIVFALINIAPDVVKSIVHDPITVIEPYEAPPPPPVTEKKEVKAEEHADEKIFVTDPPVAYPLQPQPLDTTPIEPTKPVEPVAPIGTAAIVEPPPAPPPLMPAEVDPRYGDSFQPPYPADKLREEAEGLVTVRVQIGADGRVKTIEPVGRADLSFFRATKTQALSSWRFKPATRAGVAVESWKTMTVRFEMN